MNYRRSLEAEEVTGLSGELVEGAEIPKTAPFGFYHLDTNDPFSDLARNLETEIFFHDYNDEPEKLEEEYGPYEPHSSFLMVMDHESLQPAGMVRLIHNSELGLKSFTDITKPPWNKSLSEVIEENNLDRFDANHVLDIALLAVDPKYRGNMVDRATKAALFHGMYAYSVQEGIQAWVTILDKRALRLMQLLGKPFSDFEGLEFGPYLGSKASKPVYCDVTTLADRVQQYDAEHGRDVYNTYILGRGLEDFVS